MEPSQLFTGLDDAKIPGGCDDCNAYQTFDIEAVGVVILKVHHDNSCPWLKAHENTTTEGNQ